MNAKQTLPFLVAALFAAPAAWAVDTAAAATANETAGSAVAQDYVNSGADTVRSDAASGAVACQRRLSTFAECRTLTQTVHLSIRRGEVRVVS